MSTPAPVLTSLQAHDLGWQWWIPSAHSMAVYARSYGWEVKLGFARGYTPGRKLDSWDLTDSIGCWVDGFGRRGVAYWLRKPEAACTWTASGVAVWDRMTLPPRPHLNHTDFRDWLAAEGRPAAEVWQRAIVRTWPVHTCERPPDPTKFKRGSSEAS